MDNTQQPTPAPKRTYKALAIISSVLLVLLIAVGAVGYATGYVSVVVPSLDPETTVADRKVGTKCQDLIAGYNKAFETEDANGYNLAIETAAQKAAKIEGSEQDPTCQYIQFTDAVINEDADRAAEYATKIESLSKKGQYISGELANPMGIDSVVSTAKVMNGENPAETKSSSMGEG